MTVDFGIRGIYLNRYFSNASLGKQHERGAQPCLWGTRDCLISQRQLPVVLSSHVFGGLGAVWAVRDNSLLFLDAPDKFPQERTRHWTFRLIHFNSALMTPINTRTSIRTRIIIIKDSAENSLPHQVKLWHPQWKKFILNYRLHFYVNNSYSSWELLSFPPLWHPQWQQRKEMMAVST
jgi:hypothetical protein